MQIENRPSKKQRELLSFIDGFIKGHGYGPSYREVTRALDYKSVSTVATHIDGLIKKGYLIKKDNSARSLEVVSSEESFAPKSVASKTDEKWLVDKINEKFQQAEKDGCTQKEKDDLYVLVGSLHVLGFQEAANSFKPRLKTLGEQIDEEGK